MGCTNDECENPLCDCENLDVTLCDCKNDIL